MDVAAEDVCAADAHAVVGITVLTKSGRCHGTGNRVAPMTSPQPRSARRCAGIRAGAGRLRSCASLSGVSCPSVLQLRAARIPGAAITRVLRGWSVRANALPEPRQMLHTRDQSTGYGGPVPGLCAALWARCRRKICGAGSVKPCAYGTTTYRPQAKEFMNTDSARSGVTGLDGSHVSASKSRSAVGSLAPERRAS